MDYYAVTKTLLSFSLPSNWELHAQNGKLHPKEVVRGSRHGSHGIHLFTQITDGMVKLYEATSDKNYLWRLHLPLLPSLGNQHSHGFLNTLLGVMRLYQATKAKSMIM